MKNRIKTCTVCLLIMVFFSLTAVYAHAANAQKIVDQANLLSDEVRGELEKRFQDIAEKYQMDMVLLTTPSCNGMPQTYTEDFYESNGYGYGPNDDGVIFMIATQERKFHMAPFEGAMYVFTDYGMDQIDEIITPYLKAKDYDEAFTKYADLCEEYFGAASNGTPFDVSHPHKVHMSFFLQLLISMGIGLVIAGIVIGILYAQLKSVGLKKEAQEYVKSGSFKVKRQSDLFLYHTVVKHKIEKKSGGGTSSHTTSGGHSAGGHTGSF